MEGNEMGENKGDWNWASSTQVTRPKLQNPDADSGVFPVNWASLPPSNDCTFSQLPFPPKLDCYGSPFHGEPTLSSPASPRAPTAFSSVSKATTIDHHHDSTPHKPRDVSQALVGAPEHRRWMIEAIKISRVSAGFE